jgi:hypothetical protein
MFQPRQEVIPDAMDVDEEPVQSISSHIHLLSAFLDAKWLAFVALQKLILCQ